MSDRADQLAADLIILRREIADVMRLATEASLRASSLQKCASRLEAQIEQARSEDAETAAMLDEILYRDRCEGSATTDRH